MWLLRNSLLILFLLQLIVNRSCANAIRDDQKTPTTSTDTSISTGTSTPTTTAPMNCLWLDTPFEYMDKSSTFTYNGSCCTEIAYKALNGSRYQEQIDNWDDIQDQISRESSVPLKLKSKESVMKNALVNLLYCIEEACDLEETWTNCSDITTTVSTSTPMSTSTTSESSTGASPTTDESSSSSTSTSRTTTTLTDTSSSTSTGTSIEGTSTKPTTTTSSMSTSTTTTPIENEDHFDCLWLKNHTTINLDGYKLNYTGECCSEAAFESVKASEDYGWTLSGNVEVGGLFPDILKDVVFCAKNACSFPPWTNCSG
ncbi:hypothetical protein CAEBREN_12464 [Caenorhabditis brenneri]|uniref:Uncharacterized protein n=1 Tax=Caenorhabditis brenneri TaxID=135651 RepID=G0PL57_CAEBE|nr:hypothetical protein CAEBREN_12464 [Caenorhabditis brenneri]